MVILTHSMWHDPPMDHTIFFGIDPIDLYQKNIIQSTSGSYYIEHVNAKVSLPSANQLIGDDSQSKYSFLPFLADSSIEQALIPTSGTI